MLRPGGSGAAAGPIGYPLAMPFRPQDLHDFDIAREVRIETHTGDHSTRSTTIWVVVVDGHIFIRSVRGAKGVWYQEALANPNVTIDDRGRRLEAKAVQVHDPESIRRVSEALKRKYANDEGLAEMLDPESLNATFRVEPRTPDEVPLEAPAFLGADEPSELGPPVDVSLLDAGPPVDESIILQPHKPV
jgi:hypothetical protein